MSNLVLGTDDTLRAGVYWVGDPCYAMREENGFEDWGEICDRTNCFQLKDDSQGGIFRFETETDIDGKRWGYCAVFHTAYGDGEYKDDQGREYGVDAGMIAAIPVHLILGMDPVKFPPNGGHIVNIDRNFTPSYYRGDIKFGSEVVIHTDPKVDDDWDDYHDDDYDEEEYCEQCGEENEWCSCE